MNFVVPQFIEVESKIIGPISARQFIEILATLGVCFVWYQLFITIIALPLLLITGAIGGGLAFGKVNGQPMHWFVLNMIQTLRRPGLRVWKRAEYKERTVEKKAKVKAPVPEKEALTSSRLASISLMVDTGGAYKGEGQQQAEQTRNDVAVTSSISTSGVPEPTDPRIDPKQ